MPDMTKVEKIRKLLALAESSNPNEAASAAALAKELMIRYAIEEHHLAPNEREPVEVEYMNLNVQRVPLWEAQLAYALAPAFFCHAYFVRGLDIKMVGRKSDREALAATFWYLRGEIRKMAEKAWQAKPKSPEYTVHGKTWKNSFYQGCTTTIRHRLEETVETTEASTAIVLAERRKEVDDYVKNNIKLKGMVRTSRVNGDGYHSGVEAGKNIDLSKRAGMSKQLGA